MKKRVVGTILAGVLILSLVGCTGDSNTGSKPANSSTSQTVESAAPDTMDEASYIEKVNALPGAATDFSTAMGEIMSTADQQDLDTLLAQLEEVRSCKQPFYDFAAIDNPPEHYAEAHDRLANACSQMGDVIDEYIDFIKSAFEGTVDMTTYQEDSQALIDKLTQVTDELVQAGKAVDAIAAE